MKHFLKGAAALGIVMIANIVINVICNMNGVELNSTSTTIGSMICAMSIYHALIKNEKDNDGK